MYSHLYTTGQTRVIAELNFCRGQAFAIVLFACLNLKLPLPLPAPTTTVLDVGRLDPQTCNETNHRLWRCGMNKLKFGKKTSHSKRLCDLN